MFLICIDLVPPMRYLNSQNMMVTNGKKPRNMSELKSISINNYPTCIYIRIVEVQYFSCNTCNYSLVSYFLSRICENLSIIEFIVQDQIRCLMFTSLFTIGNK